jgi:hypothetical protein
MISGQITCHCGQEVPGYLAHAHVMPNGASCAGINITYHVPGICHDCRQGTHSEQFMSTLDTIRWETYGPDIHLV